MADGATESSFSALWAGILARAYTRGRLDTPQNAAFRQALLVEQQTWDREAPHPTAWYAQEKRERGAFATLAGLTLHAHGFYTAISVGDCAMFHFHHGRMDMFPVMATEDFGSHPDLLASSHRASVVPRRRRGRWEPGDHFILASDAAAAWVARLRLEDPAQAMAATLDAVRSRRRGDRWLFLERARGRIRNDDVTIVVVECR